MSQPTQYPPYPPCQTCQNIQPDCVECFGKRVAVQYETYRQASEETTINPNNDVKSTSYDPTHGKNDLVYTVSITDQHPAVCTSMESVHDVITQYLDTWEMHPNSIFQVQIGCAYADCLLKNLTLETMRDYMYLSEQSDVPKYGVGFSFAFMREKFVSVQLTLLNAPVNPVN